VDKRDILPGVVPVVPSRNQVLSPTQAEMPLPWFQSVKHGVRAYQWHSDHIYPGHGSSHHPAAQGHMGQVATIQETVGAVGGTPFGGSSWDLPGRLQFRQMVEITIAGESFRNTVVVASAVTAEAILGLNFLESNNCTLETGSRIL